MWVLLAAPLIGLLPLPGTCSRYVKVDTPALIRLLSRVLPSFATADGSQQAAASWADHLHPVAGTSSFEPASRPPCVGECHLPENVSGESPALPCAHPDRQSFRGPTCSALSQPRLWPKTAERERSKAVHTVAEERLSRYTACPDNTSKALTQDSGWLRAVGCSS